MMLKNYKVRPIRILGDVAVVTLTRGRFAVVDAADAYLVEGRNWNAAGKGGILYARTKCTVEEGTGKTMSMHRLIIGALAHQAVDHINGDSLDNRRANLRLATTAENGQNRKLGANSASGFKGVTWHKKCGKWQAKIVHQGDSFYLGLFDSAEQAHAAYCAAAVKFYGEFARAA